MRAFSRRRRAAWILIAIASSRAKGVQRSTKNPGFFKCIFDFILHVLVLLQNGFSHHPPLANSKIPCTGVTTMLCQAHIFGLQS